MAIDRSFVQNDPGGFVALLHFRNPQDELFRPVLTNYIRAESLFRREMRHAFKSQQRPFDVTFNELCVGQPPVLTNYIGVERASTNVMTARYPFHLVRVGEAWKWDLFEGLSGEVSAQRLAALRHKALVLDSLAGRIKDGSSTNVVEILQTFKSATP